MQSDETSTDQNQSRILLFICLVLFFDAAGAGLILPVLPDLINQLSDLDNSHAARISGWLLFTYAGMQFFFAPILGALSDLYGRRPVLMIALAGFSLDYFIMALAPSLTFLFVARLVSGLLGATFVAANAAIADISDPSQRAARFGMAGAAVGLGFIAGPAIGGLAGEQDPRWPFLIAGTLTALTCLYGLFAFPETHSVNARRELSWRRAHPVGSLMAIAQQPGVLAMIAGLFCVQLANQSYASTWAFFTKEVADWRPFSIGLSVAVYGAMMVVIQGGLAGPVIRRFGERPALIGGVACGIAGYGILIFANSGAAIYAGIVAGGLSGFFFPACQSLMSRATPADAQGELQGAVTASYSLAAILGPLSMAQVFGAYTDDKGMHFPGAPFVLAVGLIALALIVFSSASRKLS